MDPYADKRTWRHSRSAERVSEDKKAESDLTAWTIMEARAIDRGFRESPALCSQQAMVDASSHRQNRTSRCHSRSYR